MTAPLVLYTSALIAVVLGENDAEWFASVLTSRRADIRISAATLVECKIVVEAKQGAEAVNDLQRLLERLNVEIAPFDSAQAQIALASWRRYGKGRHPAALNLGDCYSYALAKSLGAELLYKGNDFSQTDILSVI